MTSLCDSKGDQTDSYGADMAKQDTVVALVSSAGKGDQDAWNGLVDRYAATVWAVARGHRLNAADAADVSQTTWLRLIEHLHRIEHPERVGAWLATTARRESLRVLRLAGRQIPNGDDFANVVDVGAGGSPEHDVAVKDRKGLINELVDQLPIRSQILLRLLSADSPLSYREITEALDMPIGSIGPTRARALEQLRRLALKAGLEPDDVFA